MMEKLTHKQHKWFLTIAVFIVFLSGLLFGIDAYGVTYLEHTVEIVSTALVFVNTFVLIFLVAIVVKLEEDFHYHKKLLKQHHDRKKK